MEKREKYERKIEKYVTKGFKVLFMIIVGIMFIFLMGYVLMLLWNWLMPDIFGLTTLRYWQAIGLLALAKIIFGFGNKGGSKNHKKNKHQNKFKRFCDKKGTFSDWKHYDAFWKEEGESAYTDYVARKQKEE
ncbi:MAG: hypothetical protein AAF348_04035 [Bacteroidota bacterium]